jgi:hypothetical protein
LLPGKTELQREEEALQQTIRLEQRFTNHLFVYGIHSRRDEEITSRSTTPIREDEFRTNTLGGGYDYERLFLSAEYSKSDSREKTSRSTRLNGRYNWRITRDTTLSTFASQTWYDFTNSASLEVDLFNVGASLASQLIRRLNLHMGVDWRDESDSDFGDTTGFRFNKFLNYRFRRLSVEIGGEYYTLERPSTDTLNSNIYMKVKRRF